MANRVTVYLVVSVLFISTATVQNTRLKIKLSDRELSSDGHWHKRQTTANSACDDVVEITRSSLTLPGMLDRLNERVKFYRSEFARQGLQKLQERQILGLGGQTVSDVFQALRERQCLPFVIGGSVRDQFLGNTPNDVDVEVDCPAMTARDVCETNWGEENCAFTESSGIGHIGSQAVSKDDAIDYASTDAVFYGSLFVLEYTVNALAYDTNGNDVIVDIPGTGVTDVCNKYIKIPSDDNSESSWDEWRVRDVEGGQTDYKKLYRFWKLRVKGFQPFNEDTLGYIVRFSRLGIEGNATTVGFKSFYCDAAYGGSRYDQNTAICSVSPDECVPGTLQKAFDYNTVLAEDFVSFWDDVILPDVLPLSECECPPGCTADYCTMQQQQPSLCTATGGGQSIRQTGSISCGSKKLALGLLVIVSFLKILNE